MIRAVLRSVPLFRSGVFLAGVAFFVSPASASAQPSWVDPGQWQTSGQVLPVPLSDVMTVTSGSYVYALGGLNNSVAPVNTTYYARIGSGGLPGPWQASTSLPVPIGYSDSAVAYDGYIYVFGGWSGKANQPSKTVYDAPIQPNGSIGVWQTDTSLPGVISDTTVQVYNGYAYVIGGMPNRESDVSAVYYAKLNTQGPGSVGPWSSVTDPAIGTDADRSSVVNNGYLYIFGGRDPSANVSMAVYSAKLAPNGAPGNWAVSPNHLLEGLYNTAAVTRSGYVYLIGGMDNSGTNNAVVFYAQLDANGVGSVGSWIGAHGQLPQGIDGAGAVVTDDTIYAVGGWTDDGQGTNSIIYNTPAKVVTRLVKTSSTQDTPGPVSSRLILIDCSTVVFVLVIVSIAVAARRKSHKTEP